MDRAVSGNPFCLTRPTHHRRICFRPDFRWLLPSTVTLPVPLRRIKASEKVSIPDTNTIVCTFLLDGVSL